jgi:UDP-2,3-diacylglucosamine pyrophosphatase LpxH
VNESLLLLSDVHLGSDLNDSGQTHPRSEEIDADLAECLAHYAKERPGPLADRWRLIVVGDFVDFVGMSVDPRPGDSLRTELSEMEKAYGLGGAEDRVLLKLARAEERHPDVFASLRTFVGAGHAITFLQGNHDLEMHWEAVQEAFRDRVCSDPEARARVDFEPWFVHRDGLIYVEHGHQYDPFCSIPYILAPLSPRDRNRVFPSLSDALLRYIVRRTPGMKEYGHEGRGLASYISWGLMLGYNGAIDLGRRFIDCITMLRHVAEGYATPEGAKVKAEHEDRLVARARKSGVAVEKLQSALALHVPSLCSTPRLVLASVMLDRFGVSVLAIGLLVLFLVLQQWVAVFVLGVVFALLHVELARGRPSVDPAQLMAARASDLVRLFPASFVVMGHTHVPDTRELGGAATYVNLGSWAEGKPEESEKTPYRAARTHLVVHDHVDRHEAELRAWRDGRPEAVHALVRPLAD